MTNSSSGYSRIDVEISHVPSAFIYELFTPNVVINGEKHRRPWGSHSFDLPSGSYEISVSYPWLFMSQCGKNTVHVELKPGEIKKVTYGAGLIRYLPGKITVE
jgi:hypothetical protein